MKRQQWWLVTQLTRTQSTLRAHSGRVNTVYYFRLVLVYSTMPYYPSSPLSRHLWPKRKTAYVQVPAISTGGFKSPRVWLLLKCEK